MSKMIKIPDIYKIYIFVLFGVGIGYLSHDEPKNLFILGVPMFLLMKNTQFSCYTDKIKYERQKSFNHGLNLTNDCIKLFREWNPENMDDMRLRVQEIIHNMMGGMDLQSLLFTGLNAFMTSR